MLAESISGRLRKYSHGQADHAGKHQRLGRAHSTPPSTIMSLLRPSGRALTQCRSLLASSRMMSTEAKSAVATTEAEQLTDVVPAPTRDVTTADAVSGAPGE